MKIWEILHMAISFRLSQSVSLPLQDNNPNIVDLSDKYRPSKLAEIMSELYDNQWTDAFTYLEDNWGHGNTFSETGCIEILLNVLMPGYVQFCLSKITNDGTDGLSNILLTAGPNKETEVIWALKDIRQNNILTQLPTYEKMCVVVLINMKLSRDSSFSKHLLQDKLYEYLQECVKFCLLMAVQDSPVCLVCEGWKIRQTIKRENYCPLLTVQVLSLKMGVQRKEKSLIGAAIKNTPNVGNILNI